MPPFYQDDTLVIHEELHIVVDEGDETMIPLSAKGMGTTLHCKQDLTNIDLGPQLTNNPFERTIVLENKGRRHQALRWTNKVGQMSLDDLPLIMTRNTLLTYF